MRTIQSLDISVIAWERVVIVGRMVSLLVRLPFELYFIYKTAGIDARSFTADGHDMIFDHVSVSWGRGGSYN